MQIFHRPHLGQTYSLGGFIMHPQASEDSRPRFLFLRFWLYTAPFVSICRKTAWANCGNKWFI